MEQVLPFEGAEAPESAQAARRRRRWRVLKDRAFAFAMATGGIGVIAVLLLMFVYLLYVVAPLFVPARLEAVATYPLDLGDAGAPVHLGIDEYGEVGFAVTAAGGYAFYATASGTPLASGNLTGGRKTAPGTISAGDPATQTLAIGLADGRAVLARPNYTVSYPGNRRKITPSIVYPLGATPLRVIPRGARIALIAAQSGADETTIAARTTAGDLFLTHVTRTEALDGRVTLTQTRTRIDPPDTDVTQMIIDVDQREFYLASAGGFVSYYDIRNQQAPRLIDREKVVGSDRSITAMKFLAGGISILVGDSSGTITQWFPVRDDKNNHALARVRAFKAFKGAVRAIVPEYFRKGFVALGDAGKIALFHTTAHRRLLRAKPAPEGITAAAIAPRADCLAVLGAGGGLQFFRVHNEHPEVSWRTLWGRVWYESRAAAAFVWQSSSASSDFEPKFSLTPLVFGTFKAGFYAMLFSIPLAILGAVYTAYFMSPRMRSFVKPSVELMAALPTVILGFLAGLWLAPLVENLLAGIFIAVVLIPLVFVVSCYAFERLPGGVRQRVPEGWEAALLVPVVCLAVWAAMLLNDPVEALFFGGDLRQWMAAEYGIGYDQRNSVVVGIAVGFSVIPIIFSISEDAVFGVPRHLTIGSLALGATPWQTMTRVVLLTASPGIFSGVMIGFGRAVGETMIVLMATGNTPIMDFNVFQGFRALSANIAVEMPESEVGSTHYRVLFLAAMVLFLATFFFNTLAEVVRQRLRVKYSNL